MTETGELMRPSIVDRVRMHFADAKLSAGPVSREAIRQIRKIQYMVPKGVASQDFDNAKRSAIAKFAEKDAQAKKEQPWVWLANIVKLWFYAPVVVAAFPARSSLHEEMKQIKESGKKWRKYLRDHGEKIKDTDAVRVSSQRVNEIASHIMAGQLPTGMK